METSKTDPYGKEYDMMLYWYITQTCNFSCPQCAGGALKLVGDDAPEVIDLESLRSFLSKTEKTIRFSFTGGEPLLVKNIVEVLEEITKKHYFSMVTNLVNSRVAQLVERINPERSTFIAASAHIAQLKRRNLLQIFLQNARLIKNKGFKLFTTEVAYPYLLNKVDEYRKIFSERGFDLDFMAFRGEWKDKNYPDAYTLEEIEIFGLEKSESLRPDIFKNRGKPCIAGFKSAVIMHDGNIIPCFEIFKNIGNITQQMHLSDKMIRCPVDFCGCPVNVFEPYLYEKAIQKSSCNRKL
jgi:MoaA/NifB/PqqE/SkfB family radical SAM enzyme